MRSLLMVPAHKSSCLEKAPRLGADHIVCDLEDSVPIGSKSTALHTLSHHLEHSTMRPFVRINPCAIDEELDQLSGRIGGVMVPKVKGPSDIPRRCRQMPVMLVIETAMAIVNLDRLMELDCVIGAVFGVGDYSADMRLIDRPWAGTVNERFVYAKQKLATVARAFDKMALDTSFFVKGPSAADETRKQWTEVASWGFTGASPIHPAQIPVANEVFFLDAQKRNWSRNVISTADQKLGEVYVDYEGFVVGPPHVKQAQGQLR